MGRQAKQMMTITKKYEIEASVKEVWECLTSADKMDRWGAAPANFELSVGSSFDMWGDYLEGTVTNIVEHELLEEDWVVSGMKTPSKVKFELSELDGKTSLLLTHSDVPDELAEELDQGWDDHYLGAIKDYLEQR